MVIFIVFYFLIVPDNLISQIPDLVNPENLSTSNRVINVRIYPVSMVFNGFGNYDLRSKIADESGEIRSNYINGIYYYYSNGNIDTTFSVSVNQAEGLRFDAVEFKDNYHGTYGYGKYFIKISWSGSPSGFDTCTAEFDAGTFVFANDDLELDFRDDNNGVGGSGPRIVFHWAGTTGCPYRNISDVGRELKSWEPCPAESRNKEYGNFIYDNSNNNPYSELPLDSRKDCNVLSSVPEQNQIFDDNRSGNLTLNLTIDKNITTRDSLVNYITNITLPAHGYLKINPGKIFNVIHAVNGYNNLIVQDSSELRVLGELIVGPGNVLTLKNKGKIIIGNKVTFKPGSYFCNEGGKIEGRGYVDYEKGSHTNYCPLNIERFYSDSVKVILEDSAIVEIPDSVTLHFSGKETSLILNLNSKLKLGAGSKIIIDSSASLIANGAEFSSLDSTKKWEGIVLQNSSYDTIKNCTFKNAKTSISIINSSNYSYLRRIIRDNVFYVPSGGDYKAIYGENNYRILIAGNTFNMPVVSSGSYIYTGVYLKNSSTSGAMMDDDDPVPQYLMNIVNNTFNNGSTSIILANYISSSWPCYIGNNSFNNASDINLIGIKLSGRIKNNNFSSTNVPMAVHLINSSPDMFGNSITARDISLHLAGHCYPNLAPYISDDYLVWTGGKNALSTVELDNVQLSSTGNVFTDLGKNTFNTDNSNADHIYGFVDSSFVKYDTRNNCWLPYETAKINLKKYFDSVAIATLNSSVDCEETISPVSLQIDYLGSEMYDTVLISDYDLEGQTPEEDILWSQGKHYTDLLSWNDAITTYKYLIDNYPDYENTESSANYLYACYQALDTAADTSYRNTLYGNLRSYLEDKIESGIYSSSGDFEDVAHDIILACKTIIGNYNDALNGYEFISLFHPDPNIRLIASWDYEEVEALINSGYGGGERDLEFGISDLEFKEKKEVQRMEDVIKDDPMLRKMKENFEKKSEERKIKIEKETSKESKLPEMAKENIRKSAQLDNLKEDRAKRNIFESSLLSPKEKEKRRMEDMLLTSKNIRNISNKNDNPGIILQYKLEQNYPNPFNPTTKINFTIPKDEKVTLKIYDILGKEVKTLVNDYRNAGSYQVIFNGINLSSGVYYFKLESGSFTQVRKMVLVK